MSGPESPPAESRSASVVPGSGPVGLPARKPHPSPSAVAAALARAFLAAESWSADDLVRAGATILGVRRRWLPPLVGYVLSVRPLPPAGAPRELAAIVANADSFQSAVARAQGRRKPIRLARYLPDAEDPAVDLGVALAKTVGTEPLAPRPIEALADLADLADLLGLTDSELAWFADTRHFNRRAPAGPLHHYRYEWRARPGRAPRLLEVPGPRLRAIQRKLLSAVLVDIPLNDAAHGFVRGRSAVTGAAAHTGAEVVINLDLSTFFARVAAGRVYGVLRQAGLPEAVAHSATGLCTNAVPPRVIAAMPPGGDSDERFGLRQSLAAAHLPQGAPTSPALANLAVRRLDSRLAGWAGAADAAYTRYADDLAFSGGAALARRADAFVRGVRRIVEDEGHAVNPRKTRVRGAGVRQQVTGVVVNEHTNLARADFDRLKAILHNCVRHGPESQNREGRADFRAYLLGRVTWAESLNPGKARRLRDTFDLIAW